MAESLPKLVIKKSRTGPVTIALLIGGIVVNSLIDHDWTLFAFSFPFTIVFLGAIFLVDHRIMVFDGGADRATIRIDGGSEIEFRISDIERLAFDKGKLYVQAGGTCFVHRGLGGQLSSKDQDRVIDFLASRAVRKN